MKPLIVLTLMLFTGAAGFCQSALTQKFKKDVPVQITYYERLYDADNTKVSKNKLRKTKLFTDDEVDEIFTRLGNASELPPGLGNGNREALQHYVVYEISNFTYFGYKFSLIWIPYAENRHMPQSMQPPTKDGAIFYTYTKHLSFNGKDAAGNSLAVAGTPLPDLEPINTSVADMSGFTSGMKGVPQVFRSDADAGITEKGESEYQAMFARLPEISKEYSVVRDKVFAQVEKDRKTGVQANLFMKKERETGQKLLDEWHSLIDGFLKKYDSYITAEAKETISSWHDQALYYIDF